MKLLLITIIGLVVLSGCSINIEDNTMDYRTKFIEERNRTNDLVGIHNKYLNFFQGEICEDKTFKGSIELRYVPNWIIDSDYYCDINKIVNGTISCYVCNKDQNEQELSS